MDAAIEEFFTERKAAWLKSNTKASMDETENLLVHAKCEEIFALDNWLPDAARRAGQLSLASHPSKFSHPSSKTSAVIAQAGRAADGCLRTGNASVELDAFGNAAALAIFKFISIKMHDDKSILEHVEEETAIIKKNLAVKTASFEEIRRGLLAIKGSDASSVTSGKVKQVYFPCAESYHLLSILTPSGLVFELRKRISNMHFSDATTEARKLKKKDQQSDAGFDELFNLSMIGYGGTKPQNISVLNSQNGGKAYLLPSMPPTLRQRSVRHPKYNFFGETLWVAHCKEVFTAYHKLLKADWNNQKIRNGLERRIKDFVDQVVERMWAVRHGDHEKIHSEIYANLPAHQRIWLSEAETSEREASEEWLDALTKEMARWFVLGYEKSLSKQRILLGDAEQKHIRDVIAANKEALR